MAKYSENPIPSKSVDWSHDPTNGLPYSGGAVQEWLKNELENRAGCFYYDATNNRFLVFADEVNKELYLSNPTEYASMLIGAFDAPFNYTASIQLIDTSTVNYIQNGSTGNYIKASFDVVNKSGASVGENMSVTITFRNGSAMTRIVRTVAYGSVLNINVDDYLLLGTNVVTIAAVGQNTLAATSIGITYYSIKLVLTDSFDISQHVSPTGNLNISFNIVGNGIKRLEWYIDGSMVAYDPQNDDVTAGEASRTKTIPLSSFGLSNGRHNLQYRAYVDAGNGDLFYSDTLYRDFIVDNGYLQDYLTVVAFDFPYSPDYGANGIIDAATEPIPLYGAVQYTSKDIRYAVNSPFGEAPIQITLAQSSIMQEVSNRSVYTYTLQSFDYGETYLSFAIGTDILEFNVHFEETRYEGLEEVVNGLAFSLDKRDRTNTSDNKDEWSYGPYTATMTGFTWTDRSGWTSRGLLIPSGASFVTDYSPLSGNIVSNGATLEFEIETERVIDDSVVICDLRTNGVGLLITASEASLTSRGGIRVSTKYRSGVPLRVSFVVNSPLEVRNKNLLFIYIDGILAGAMNYPETDSFTSNAYLRFVGSEYASVIVKQVRCYNRALSASEILNNFILYRPTAQELVEVYDRNDILDTNNQPSFEKLAAYTPIIVVTGDVEKLMNFDRSNKGTYVKMGKIEIINNLDPTKNLTIVDASMRCQGTSSMDYPRKNFRFYLKKDSADTTVDSYVTRVFDYQGYELTGGDRKYAFKDGSQEVSCWCLKADYAESSSTHNTGVARLWNNVMKNAVVQDVDQRHYILSYYPNSKTPCRTLAQHAANAEGFDKDVRTTVDGFPIVLFYHKNESDPLICLGKYNWNNDKSTESVYGFVDIPGFNDVNMECWEVVNGDYDINQFISMDNWSAGKNNGGWQDSFESRYPDDSGDATEATRAEGALKTVCTWVNSTKGAATILNNEIVVGDSVKMTRFSTEKWDHLDVYKVAAYYVYLMRFGGVDQTVKNAMFTTEDGIHWYYINYDNDTILGVRNDGLLKFGYDIDRQSRDPDNANAYCYAGHDSVLWNNLEADAEFMSIVRVVDQALFNSGLTYPAVIDMFNNQQSGSWSERLHNYDYTFKYLDVWLDDQNMQLEKLQGPRRTHREWWLSNRFARFDAINMTGQYLQSYVSIKPATDGATTSGDVVRVTPKVGGQVFGWRLGTNGSIYSANGTADTVIPFDLYAAGISYYIGGSLFFFNAVYMQKIDFSSISSHIQELSFDSVNSDVFDSYLEEAVVSTTSSVVNTSMTAISNLGRIKFLRKLQVCNCTALATLNLSNNIYLEELDARGCTALASVALPVAAPLTTVKLSTATQTLNIKDLVDLASLTIESNGPSLVDIRSINCKPFNESITWLKTWITGKTDSYLEGCTVYIDGIDWTDVSIADLVDLGKIGNLVLRGKIQANFSPDPSEEVAALHEIYGEHCLESTNDLWIYGSTVFHEFSGPSTIVEGRVAQYTLVVIGVPGTIQYSIQNNNRPGVTINELTGRVTTTLNNIANSQMKVFAYFTPTDSSSQYYIQESIDVTVLKEIYPSNNDIVISGPTSYVDSSDKNYSAVINNTSDYTGMDHITHQWSVTGDLGDYYYIASQPSDSLTCIVKKSNDYVIVGGAIKLSLINSLGLIVAENEINVIAQSGNVAVSRLSNAPIMTAFWNAFGTNGTKEAGKLSNPDYITKFEATTFSNSDLGDGTLAGSIFYPNRFSITHFEEIQYFTSLTDIPDALLRDCVNLTGNLPLPSGVTHLYVTALPRSMIYNEAKKVLHVSGDGVLTVNYPGSSYPRGKFNGSWSFPNCTSINISYAGFTNGFVLYIPKCTNINAIFYDGIDGEIYVTTAAINRITNTAGPAGRKVNLTVSKYAASTTVAGWRMGNNWPSLLKSISIEEDVTNFEIYDECLYDVQSKTLLCGPYAKTSVEIKPGTLRIGGYAFCSETSLASIIGTDSLNVIGERAFFRCSSLASFVFPNTLTSISQYAFSSSGLTSVNIPDVNCSLPVSCFEGCTSLVTVRDGTKQVGSNAYKNCTALETVVLSQATSANTTPFTGCSSVSYIYLPAVFGEALSGWVPTSQFLITAGPEGGGYNVEFGWTTAMGGQNNGNGNYTLAFGYLKEITIPATITYIRNYLTHGSCRNVEKIYSYAMTAPTIGGDYAFTNLGDNTKDSGTNELHVPVGATGYDTGRWATIVNDKGFTLIYDL